MSGTVTPILFARKRSTGAVWYTLDGTVWVKDSLGCGYSRKTKRVGYSTTQFNPRAEHNLRRFEVFNETC